MRPSYVTRKFAIRSSNKAEYKSFLIAIGDFRDLENCFSEKLGNLLQTGLFPDKFRRKGETAPNALYSELQFRNIQFSTSSGLPFQSRTKRAAFYYPYFAVRNGLIAASNRHSASLFLFTLLKDDWGAFSSYIKSGELPEDKFRELKSFLKTDLYGYRQNMPAGLLQNTLRHIRNILLDSLASNEKVLLDILLSTTIENQLRSDILQGFTRKKHGHIVCIPPQDLPMNFFKRFTRRIKGDSTRIYKRTNRSSNSRGVLIKNLRKVPYIAPTLNEWNGETLASFKNHIAEMLDNLDHTSTLPELKNLTEEVICNMCLNYSAAHPKTVLKPHYSRFRAGESLGDAYEKFIRNQLENKVRELLPDLLLAKGSVLSNEIRNTLENLCAEGLTEKFFQIPKFSKFSIHVPSRDQFYDVLRDDKQESVTLALRIYPANPGRGISKDKIAPPFKFSVPKETLRRVVLKGNGWDGDTVRSFFQAVPTIRIESGKIIICQPIPNNPPTRRQQDTTAAPETVMGLDLGLKHYAVVSVMQHKEGEQVEIGRHFLGQRTVFNRTFDKTLRKFVEVKHCASHNIHRKLEQLHKQLRKTQHLKNLAENDHPGSRYAYLLGRDEKYLWHKIQNLHTHMVHMISHTILEVADVYKVSVIKVEDLTWSQHSSKREVGGWLAHHQVRWFHSRIIYQLICGAYRSGIRVDRVNARYSSRICAHHSADLNKRFTKGSKVRDLRVICLPALGNRRGKVFSCAQGHQIDADLNAARNLALRPALSVISISHLPPP